MGRLKRMSGDDVVAILKAAGFVVVGQKGSHVKLRRVSGGTAQTLVVPRHAELDIGTLQAIYRQACQFVPEGWLRPRFHQE